MVEDVAEGDEGEAEDREQAQTARAIAARWRWESLMEDTPVAETARATASTDSRQLQLHGNGLAESAPGDSGGSGILRRGVIRYVYLLMDMTEASRQPDYKPRRLEYLVEAAGSFVRRFLAENPLAEIGLLVLRGGGCEVALPLRSSPDEFREKLAAAAADGPRGRMSIVAGLLRVLSALEEVPPYGMREALLFFASLSTCDPQEKPIDELLSQLKKQRVRVSVVSLSPELHILRRACAETGGSFAVALDARHFQELLSEHLSAPACSARSVVPRLVRMGFPKQVAQEAPGAPATCACHLQPRPRLFACPQCHARTCTVPSRCCLCELPLASQALLARAFRSLLPLPPFGQAEKRCEAASCGGCCLPIQGQSLLCRSCKHIFCEGCNDFLHEVLRQCPGCLTASSTGGAPPDAVAEAQART